MIRAPFLLLAMVLPLLSTGCVTARLWESRAGFVRRGPPPRPPLRVERAVRDGRGAYHLLVDCGAGQSHHVVVQRARPEGGPPEQAEPPLVGWSGRRRDTPDEAGTLWPHAGRNESAMVLADPAPLPAEGVPLATWSDDGHPPADPRAPTSLEASVATPGPRLARVELHGDSFELVHPDGRRELLAHVSPHRRPWPADHADEVTARDVGAVAVCVLATPLTAAADVVVFVTGALWYPFSLLGQR